MYAIFIPQVRRNIVIENKIEIIVISLSVSIVFVEIFSDISLFWDPIRYEASSLMNFEAPIGMLETVRSRVKIKFSKAEEEPAN